jgi:hypothetical protein
MNSLTHITQAEIARFYFLEGVISGNDKKVDYLNGVQQNYVVSRMYNFNTWDAYNQSMTKLYIKENIPKMEIKYDTIKKEKEQELIKKKEQELIKKKEQENDMKKQIIHDLFLEPNENVRKIVLQRFYISENDYYNERERERKRNLVFVQQRKKEKEQQKVNEICARYC